jgi:hypothetical protein
MPKIAILVGCVLLVAGVAAQAPQTPASQKPTLPATDVTAADIQKFIDALPKDAISDNPIRIVDVGNAHIGVYGVFRPKNSPQDAILHDVTTSEIYYVLEGSATLVTGGTIAGQGVGRASATATRGSRIDGGVSRHIGKGDVVIIPPRTPHWWTNLESDLRYLIFRPDPASRSQLR